MPQWLKEFVLAAFAMLKAPLTTMAAYLTGLRQGRTQQRADQSEQDIEAARKARLARHDAARNVVRDDPNDRDNL